MIPASTKRRLALFFDGTWNEPGDNTNVWRQKLMLADHDQNGIPQDAFYDEGVGTHFYDRLTGGAFGAGLSKNIRKGYRWLIEHYNPGDEIYLFGFSRGAFTARSLAGLISKCGLLRPEAPISFVQLFDRYRKGSAVRTLYQLIRERETNPSFSPDFEERAILDHAYYRRDLIKMVGVWDTVGSLGVPLLSRLIRRGVWFHNTHLSTTVQHSYQALALDEQRKPYWAILWTAFIPDSTSPTVGDRHDDRMIEQRWFAGAHANVGGGYRSDLLPERPLAWLQGKAHACGLAFRASVRITNADLQEAPRDSYREFLRGLWPILTLGHRYVRWVMADPVKKTGISPGTGTPVNGSVITVNERLDESISLRWRADPTYRPASLYEWARRKGLDIDAVMANFTLCPNYWAPVQQPGIEK
jgi:uncharacterized protein (DUF2235 family)